MKARARRACRSRAAENKPCRSSRPNHALLQNLTSARRSNPLKEKGPATMCGPLRQRAVEISSIGGAGKPGFRDDRPRCCARPVWRVRADRVAPAVALALALAREPVRQAGGHIRDAPA